MSEMYTNYYDILVRHSLGNFRDLLKEIAYSPVMGTWLTFKGSSSFASSGTYPDENFSREIMELFSIGLFNLNPDGTPVRDELGEPVPTCALQRFPPPPPPWPVVVACALWSYCAT
jgi:hypothetical protein